VLYLRKNAHCCPGGTMRRFSNRTIWNMLHGAQNWLTLGRCALTNPTPEDFVREQHSIYDTSRINNYPLSLRCI
jgi:hypothetical protein